MMRRNTWLALSLLVLAALAAVGWGARAQGSSKVIWEYQIVTSRSAVPAAKLNQYGADGWELVWVTATEDRVANIVNIKHEYYFKRAK